MIIMHNVVLCVHSVMLHCVLETGAQHITSQASSGIQTSVGIPLDGCVFRGEHGAPRGEQESGDQQGPGGLKNRRT